VVYSESVVKVENSNKTSNNMNGPILEDATNQNCSIIFAAVLQQCHTNKCWFSCHDKA